MANSRHVDEDVIKNGNGTMMRTWIGLITLVIFAVLIARLLKSFVEQGEPWVLQPRLGQENEDTNDLLFQTAVANSSGSPINQESDDLTAIVGIGPAYAAKLQNAGIINYKLLASLTTKQIESIVQAPDWRQPDYAGWIYQARRLCDDSRLKG